MINTLKKYTAMLILLSLTGSGAAIAEAQHSDRYLFAGPVGAWVLTVEFPVDDGAPPPPPAFTETLTFHALGTVSESNTLLNENSYNPALGQGCGFNSVGGLELNCNGGEGTGTWRRTGRNSLTFVAVKFVYDGATNAHVGYLRVSGKLRFDRESIRQASADGLTEILIGTDLESAVAIPLGGADASGVRIH